MSDDLERFLQETTPRRRSSPINPRIRTVPRVHGGPPLDGGPRLDIPLSLNDSDEDAEVVPIRPILRSTPERTFSHQHPPILSGPHLEMPCEEESVPAASTSLSPLPQPVTNYPPCPIQNRPEHLRSLQLHKSYQKGPVKVPVLRGVDISVSEGEFLAIVGQSGSGKSTLLHLMGTLDSPDRGEIYFSGKRIDNLPRQVCDSIRNQRLGMIFQFYHLLPELTTLENVLSPLMIAEGAFRYWRNRRKHHETAKRLLDLVGLGHRLKHTPRELSGGEMQRAAIARALIAQPELLLADEPTGNLDQATGQEILNILQTLNKEQNLTIVMVTHDLSLAQQADRIVRLAGGRIEE